MSFKTPKLSEEEMSSWSIPDQLKCDSCQAVAFQIHSAFEAAHKPWINNPNYKISEAEIIDVSEKVCNPPVFEVYGISMTDTIQVKTAPYKNSGSEPRESSGGEERSHRLKGPGVWNEPGAAHMGGKTPLRLAEMCTQFMDNLEEYRVYQLWLLSGRSLQPLKEFLCQNPLMEQGMNLNLCNMSQLPQAKDEL